MAKKKESLKDINVDLKPRAEKISEEHLQHMRRLVNSISTLQFNIGKVETQKHTMLHNLSITQDKIAVFQDTLKKEYGTFDVNIEDGKINWPEESNDEK
tara:strand:+ start:3671 stop:3967 length:297 start_codon:yes stop_codon:yes gene_type:complete